MAEIIVAASKFLRVFDSLGRIGLDVEAIAAEVGISPQRIAELPGDTRLPALHYSRLYKAAVVEMQTLLEPIPWAAGVGSESFELMCHCMISARTLGEALRLAARFEKMVYPMIRFRIELVEEGEVARLRYHIRFKEEKSQLVPQEWDRAGSQDTVARASGLMVWHALCGWLVGRPIETLEVKIAAPYLNEAYYDRLYGIFHCQIQFDAKDNEMVIPVKDLEQRLVHTPDSLQAFLDNAVYELIAIEHKPASTSTAIKSIISIDLPSGIPSFADISDQLHMSESSLRRRLRKENTSYQALKDEVRCQIAIDKLLRDNPRVADLADYLGFTEASSFVRSFKAWTGETPVSYREKVLSLGIN
jgi:AraC-like DNA-binding protein